MMSKFKFGFYSEKEYCVFKEYRPIKKQHHFHSEEQLYHGSCTMMKKNTQQKLKHGNKELISDFMFSFGSYKKCN